MLPLLIAYLLLMSQQVALSHGYTHWAPIQKAVGGEMLASASAAPEATLVDHICLQCVAAAELAFAVSSPLLRFKAPDSRPSLPAQLLLQVRERLATVVFQSRAPPVL
ncbi:hypothetical protein [Massilia sp. Root351]|jgi:hypothetical protein|uniref:hypothetical protein n=1 Tax=Massilia sp. Root351 TaxID=1736522 RepID=UPI000A472F94|nr:hypothetical protein [Massilia sp. Root351]